MVRTTYTAKKRTVWEDHRPVQTGKVPKKPAGEKTSVPSGVGVRGENKSPIVSGLGQRHYLKYEDSRRLPTS